MMVCGKDSTGYHIHPETSMGEVPGRRTGAGPALCGKSYPRFGATRVGRWGYSSVNNKTLLQAVTCSECLRLFVVWDRADREKLGLPPRDPSEYEP
jgi:hypothetical protein